MDKQRSDNTALAHAFAAFNAHSAELNAAYGQLQRQVGELAGALGAAHDARHRELEQKEVLAARLSQMLEALPAQVIVTDSQGSVCDANQLAIDALGETLLGSRWNEVAGRQFRGALDDNNELLAADGRWLTLSRSALAEGGEILVFTDVTTARHAREQAQRQERLAMLGEMAARLAHQIRTPLTAALLYASQPAGKQPGGADFARQKIAARLHELEAMVEDMLRFARGTPPDESCFSTTELLNEIAIATREILPDHISLKTEFSRPGYRIRANRRALAGAMNNLVANAIQHTPGGGSVTLSDDIDATGLVRLRVTDTGCGVSATLRNQIFEPFFTTRSEGTGLGLAVVRSVAQAHQGDVDFESDANGSVFSVCLPGQPAHEALPTVGGGAQFAISADGDFRELEYAHG